MMRTRAAALGVLLAWVACAGCMTLREIPHSEYTAKPERKALRVETLDGLVYEFDWASVGQDTLIGYRNRNEAEGPVDQVAVVRVPLQDVTRLTARELDWRRTGAVGGGVVAGAVALGLRTIARHNDQGGNSGNSKPFNP